jgi:hypothetical protein
LHLPAWLASGHLWNTGDKALLRGHEKRLINLSFPKIISGRIDDAVRPKLNGDNDTGPLDYSMQGCIFL